MRNGDKCIGCGHPVKILAQMAFNASWVHEETGNRTCFDPLPGSMYAPHADDCDCLDCEVWPCG